MAEHRFFSYSCAGGFETHETLDAARAQAQSALDDAREDALDGWDEDEVLSIAYGELRGGAEEIERKSWCAHLECEPGCGGNHHFDEFVDFDLREIGGARG